MKCKIFFRYDKYYFTVFTFFQRRKQATDTFAGAEIHLMMKLSDLEFITDFYGTLLNF